TLPFGITVDGDYVIDNSIQSGVNEDGHMLDGLAGNNVQGKLSMHPTFSKQSPHANESAGTWQEAYGNGPNGQDVFYPSREQMNTPGYAEGLARYFQHERGRGIDKIQVPPPYNDIEIEDN
ncbi:hypothetical protein DRO03_11375, partial [Methanosarcinales archaeon]